VASGSERDYIINSMLLLAFLIGFFGGLRALTAPAATAWAARLGWLQIPYPLSLIGSHPGVAILTLLALLELVADKLPRTPSRTAPPGLIARIVMGGLTGACIASGGAQGIVLGAVGGIAGCFIGYSARTGLVRALRIRDLYVALVEDFVAIAGSLWVVARF